MSGTPAVVKIGGGLLDHVEWIAGFAAAIAASERPLVVVHGGGRQVTELGRALGHEPEWRQGLRVTTPETMTVVQMVLSGSVGKRLVAALVSAGVDAIGVSGEDAGLLRAEPLDGGVLGRAGRVRSVRAQLLESWVAAGLVPVVSPVSRGPDGEPLNVNADDAAAAIAAALGSPELLLVSDVTGVLRDGGRLAALAPEEADRLIATGVAAGGMVPKLRAAEAALAAGVAAVRIGGLEMLTSPEAGTTITGTATHGHASV